MPFARWLERSHAPYLQALVAVAAATAVGLLLFAHADHANVVMVFLVAVVLAAARLGNGPSVLAAVTAVVAFVYFFVPHYNSCVVDDLAYLPTFAVLLAVGLIVATLTSRLRGEALATEAREQRSRILYELPRDLTAADDRDAVAAVADAHVGRTLGGHGWIVIADGEGARAHGLGAAPSLDATDAAAQALRRRETAHQPPHWATPLVVGRDCIGALVVHRPDGEPTAAVRQLLASFANPLAIARRRLLVDETPRSRGRRPDRSACATCC